jgi:hypothetical protein
VVSFTSRPLYPRGKSPRYPLDRKLGGLQIMNVILTHKRVVYFKLHPQKCQHNEIEVIYSSRYSCKFKSDYSTTSLMATEQRHGEDRKTQQGGTRLTTRCVVSIHWASAAATLQFSTCFHMNNTSKLTDAFIVCSAVCESKFLILTSFFRLHLPSRWQNIQYLRHS